MAVYQALYRKYRPASFDEVVGQEVDADGNMHDIIQPSYKYDPRPDEEEEN